MKFEPSQNEGRMSDKIITVAHMIGLMMCVVWAGEYAEQGRTTLSNMMWLFAFLNLIGFFRHQITHTIISLRYLWLRRHAIMEKNRNPNKDKTSKDKDNVTKEERKD